MARTKTPAPPAGPMLFGAKRANAPFAGWRPAGTQDWLLIVGVSGQGRVTVPGKDRLVESNQVLLYRPGAPQDYAAESSWEVIWAHFTPPREWLGLLEWPLIFSGVHLLELRSSSIRRNVLEALRRALAISHRAVGQREALVANALHEVLLWCDMENPGAKERKKDPRVRHAAELLTRNLQDPFSLTGLARESGLSVSRLAQLFKEQMGSSPRQYWEGHRLEHAGSLLRRTQMSVSEVAEAVGFADPFYFSTRFKSAVGKSPSQYRKIRE